MVDLLGLRVAVVAGSGVLLPVGWGWFKMCPISARRRKAKTGGSGIIVRVIPVRTGLDSPGADPYTPRFYV